MKRLTPEQLDTILAAINHRLTQFPRSELRTKLLAADKAFHLAKMTNTDGSAGTNLTDGVDRQAGKTPNNERAGDQDYSRFQELQNALTREIAETYGSEYNTTFLGKSQLFAMTSPEEKAAEAQAFNTILSDQAKRTSWAANISKLLMDVAKYNLGAVDTYWGHKPFYTLGLDVATGKVAKTKQSWAGNHIDHLDMYNTFFDTTVDPEAVATDGEWGGYTVLNSQVQLKKLIDVLTSTNKDGLFVNDYHAPDNTEFNIYSLAAGTTTASDSGHNMGYYKPEFTTYGSDSAVIPSSGGTNWLKHSGGTRANVKDKDSTPKAYTVSKFYLRIVPSAYGITIANDEIQLLEVYILEGIHVLSVKFMDVVHEQLGINLAITDSDSLGYNAAGPVQVSIPYAKTAKQLLDRVLAGADRAICDRAIYDETMIDKDVVNSKVPDLKVAMKGKLPKGAGINDYYYSIPFDNSATRSLYGDKEQVEESGRRAAGLNRSQQGQFVKGNKTLHEYQDVMANAGDRIFFRTLFLENTVFSDIKTKLKYNIIQYQAQATLMDEEKQDTVDIDPTMLYKATVSFKLVDGLMPSEYTMSPNVQQALIGLMGQNPDAFAEYDTAGIISHMLSQSMGVNMEQYKLKQPTPGDGT